MRVWKKWQFRRGARPLTVTVTSALALAIMPVMGRQGHASELLEMPVCKRGGLISIMMSVTVCVRGSVSVHT